MTISATGTTSTGTVSASVVLPTGCAQRDVSTHVAISTKQSLKTSEGCTDIGPSRIQRRAPETVRPSTNTEASPTRPITKNTGASRTRRR